MQSYIHTKKKIYVTGKICKMWREQKRDTHHHYKVSKIPNQSRTPYSWEFEIPE